MQKYSVKKQNNQDVFPLAEKHLTQKGAERFAKCGCWIEFMADEELANFKVFNAFFCKHRFCPMCMFRKARREALKIGTMMRYLESEGNRAFVLVTFTAPNVRGPDLPAENSRLKLGFKNLLKRKDVMRMNDGWACRLELTYNGDRRITREYYRKSKKYCDLRGLKVGDPNPNYDTYHPHLHVVFSVSKGYFSGGRYIGRNRWLQMWREVMGCEYITQVDVRRAARREAGKVAGEREAAAMGTSKVPAPGGPPSGLHLELAKYVVKESVLTYSQPVFDTFYKALHRRQLLTFGGSFAEAHKKYKAGELECYKTVDSTVYAYLIFCRWMDGRYMEQKRRDLDPGLYAALKRDALDDAPI